MLNLNQLKKYSPIVVRIGIALVFLWFGTQQILHSTDWISYLPTFTSHISIAPATLVLFNGIFEVIFGLLLLIGFYTRFVSAIIALHLIGIVFSVGYNEIGIRDFGLLMATISIFLNGKDDWCLDNKF